MTHPSAESTYVVSVSGGKDSAAALAYVLSSSVIPRANVQAVFADTGIEAPETYAYLDDLAQAVALPITRVKADVDFFELARQRGRFPGRPWQFCTEELKRKPIAAWIRSQGFADPCVVLGIRAEESQARAALPECSYDAALDYDVWRPILRWTTEQTFAFLRDRGIPVNPLYAAGFGRVGCFPCVFSRRAEIGLAAKMHPEFFDRIRREENVVGAPRLVDGRERGHSYFPTGKMPGLPSRVQDRRGGPARISRHIAFIDEILIWARAAADDGATTTTKVSGGCISGWCERAS